MIKKKKKKMMYKLILQGMFGTPDSNPDSVIQIQNHRVPRKKMMFGTCDLSED